MNSVHGNLSSSNLLALDRRDDLQMEGVTTSVKLLLKLIEDYKLGTNSADTHKRVASMVGILDDVKSRIERSQMVAARKAAELRRCNTELRCTTASCMRDKRPMEPLAEEYQKLRKELAASNAARKSLERMFSSLGKEKEIMATELTKKVHELTDMEEHISDIKAQNEMLLEKVKTCVAEHRGKKNGSGEVVKENAMLHERNQELSDEFLKSLEKYRVLKRRYKDTHQHCYHTLATMAEMAREASAGQLKVQELLHQRVQNADDKQDVDIVEELSTLQSMFRGIRAKVKEASRRQQ